MSRVACTARDIESRVKEAARLRFGARPYLRENPDAFVGPERIAKTMRWAELMREYGPSSSGDFLGNGVDEARALLDAAKQVVNSEASATSMAALAAEIDDVEYFIEMLEQRDADINEMKVLEDRLYLRRHLIVHERQVVAAGDTLEELLAELNKD